MGEGRAGGMGGPGVGGGDRSASGPTADSAASAYTRGMYRHLASRPARAALFLAVSLLLVMPAAVAAHAEFERSSPADGETVQGSPRVIRAFFSEGLADGSEMALLDEAGTTIAEGTHRSRESDPHADRPAGARAGRLRGPVEGVRR